MPEVKQAHNLALDFIDSYIGANFGITVSLDVSECYLSQTNLFLTCLNIYWLSVFILVFILCPP